MHPRTPALPLIETSLADAIARIQTADTLSPSTKTQWICSLGQIAKALDRPLELIPARWTALRLPVAGLHHLPLGMTAKTLANHKSNLRAALRWVIGEVGLPVRGVPLKPAWATLLAAIAHKGMRARLYGLARYASAKDLQPRTISDAVVLVYLAYRTETTALAGGTAAHRSIARTWNRCVDEVKEWPQQRLTEPDLSRRQAGPQWEDFPEGLRRDLADYLDRLTRSRRSQSGKRLAPCKPSTIRTRRAELVAFARKSVEIGIALEELTSFSALFRPEVVERVIDAYWTRDGAEPKGYTIDLAWKLHAVARDACCLTEVELQRLDDLRATIEEYRHGGLTEKNLAVIRQVLAGSVWTEVIRLPDRLISEARLLKEHAPVKAALRAQLAAAIAILTVAPVRVGNLTRIRLQENLNRPAGPDSPYWLVFPDYDVKNRVKLEFPLHEHETGLISEYVHEHRPVLLRGFNDLWLFPGENGRHKTTSMFSDQITQAVHKATGLRLTAHQFRHAAAALALQEDPGNYEWVRQVLGHKNIQTTMSFYVGLETTQANERFGEIVRKHATFQDGEDS